MLNKVSACIFFIFLLCAPAMAENVDVQWKMDGFDVSGYEDIYFDSIDMRDMRTKDYAFDSVDDDTGEDTEDYIDPQVLSELAMELFDRLSHRLRETIPINEDERLEEGKNSLVVKMNLSAEFDVESPGIIGSLLPQRDHSSEITLECFFTEALSQEKVLDITLKSKFTPEDHEEPLSTVKDMSNMSEIFDAWGYRLAMVLLNNMTNEDLQ